jgi:hypothetical protein
MTSRKKQTHYYPYTHTRTHARTHATECNAAALVVRIHRGGKYISNRASRPINLRGQLVGRHFCVSPSRRARVELCACLIASSFLFLPVQKPCCCCCFCFRRFPFLHSTQKGKQNNNNDRTALAALSCSCRRRRSVTGPCPCILRPGERK